MCTLFENGSVLGDTLAGAEGLIDLFAQAPIGMAVLQGRELLYTFANPKYQQIIGNRNPVGKRLVEMFPELAGSEIETIIERVFETAIPFSAADLLIRFDSQGTGEIDNYYDLVYHPLVATPGLPRGVIVIAVDVTERRGLLERARRLLGTIEAARVEEAEARVWLNDLVWQAPAFIAVLRGPEFVFELANENYYQLVGHRDIIGKRFADAIPDVIGQGFEEILRGVFDTGTTFTGSELPATLQRTLGGEPELHYVNIVCTRLTETDVSRSGVFAHGVDVTDQVLARYEVEAARAEAEAANRAKSEFLAVMSHELRTPLNAIGGYAELMAMGVRGPVTAEQRSDLERIQRSQRHLLGLINGVLNYAKVEGGMVNYDLGDVTLDDVLATCEALVAPQARAKRLTLSIDTSNRALAARADREKLQQIMLNLLGNAVKFTEPDGSVTLTYERDGRDFIQMRVTDTGRGIGADHIERIFAPFVQVDSGLTRTQEGTGLGLAISRDLARGMGGDLTAESELGVGSTFTLRIPAASANL